MFLAQIRKKIMAQDDPKKVKCYVLQVRALLKLIKMERTARGLPSHILGTSSYGS